MSLNLKVTPAQKQAFRKVRLDAGWQIVQLDHYELAKEGPAAGVAIDLTFVSAADPEGPSIGLRVKLPTEGQKPGSVAHLGRVCDALRMLGGEDENGTLPATADDFAVAVGRKVRVKVLHTKDGSGEVFAKVAHGEIWASPD